MTRYQKIKHQPKVGVGLIVIKNGSHVLLGKRLGSFGANEYGCIGGHMEQGETFSETALRELQEEAGSRIVVSAPRFLCLTNMTDYLPKHYIDIGMVADWVGGEPRVMEPDKLASWAWYPLDKLPSPLFAAEINYFESYHTGRSLFE